MRRSFLKDRSGKVSGAIAALLAIIVILIYTRVASTPKGSEDAFYTVYGAFKWLLKALDLLKYVEEYLKPFEEFLEYVRGTELWPLIISILALVVMELAVTAVYCGTWMTIDMTTSILGLLSGIRARRRDEKYFEFNNKKSGINLGISRIIAVVGRLGGSRQPRKIGKGTPSITPNPKKETGAVGKKAQSTTFWFKKDWWQIRETFTITLEKGKLRELILGSKKLFPTNRSPDGSYIELAEALGTDAQSLRRAVEEGRDAMTVGNLMKLLKIAEIPYDTITPYIRALGGRGDKEAIRNPKFPIDLGNPYGGIIFAAALKDGDINVAHHHFEYVNFDPEKRRIVAEAVKQVFGDVEPVLLYDRDGRVKGIHYQTSLIGDTLLDFGAVAGRKASQDYHLPDPVRYGSLATKKAYLEQAMGDEGNKDQGDYRITIAGAGELMSKLTREHHEVLKFMHWYKGRYPSGAPKRFITLKEGLGDDLPLELIPAYEDLISKMGDEWVPTILNEDKKMLEDIYEVNVNIQPRQIYVGRKVGIRGSWGLIIGGKDEVEKVLHKLDRKWGDHKK